MRIHFRMLHIPSDWLWVRAHVPVIRAEDTTGIIAQDIETGNIVGAAIFDNWSASSVQAHFMITSPMVLRHGLLEEAFSYVFTQQNMKVMIGFIAENNEKALKLNAHMGFEVIHRIPDGYEPGVDFVLMQLTKEYCRYLPEYKRGVGKHGR